MLGRTQTAQFLAPLLALGAVCIPARAQTATSFTYQGSLREDGAAADGDYDLVCSLWDSPTAGSQLGSDLLIHDVPVEDGLFTLLLDFGAAPFDGAPRWLEIEVQGVTLSPRQPVTPSPYALHTRGLFVDDAGRVGIGTDSPLDGLHLAADNAALRLQDTDVPGGYTLIYDAQPTQLRLSKVNTLSGNDGIVLLDLNPKPSDPTSLAWVRLFRETNTAGSKSLRLYRGNNTNELSASIGVDGQDSLLQLHGGNLGIGTASPEHRLHVDTPSWDGAAIYAHSSGEQGTAIRAHTSGGGFTTSLLGQAESRAGTGVLGWATATTGTNYGVVGHARSPIGYDFYANGPGQNYGASSSIRWKRNVAPIGDALGKLTRLRGVHFDWDEAHGGHHDVGMIAEEVGRVLPEIVIFEADGAYAQGMDYSKLAPLLVEAVKELRARHDDEIAALRAESELLRERIGALEAAVAALTGG